MPLPQKTLREIILQLLFCYTMQMDIDEKEIGAMIQAQHKVSKRYITSAQEKVKNILKNLSGIDAKIKKVSTGYDVHRIQGAERAILRLAFFELEDEPPTPVAVVIAEAKRLARKFSGKDAEAFIHALIDTYAKTLKE